MTNDILRGYVNVTNGRLSYLRREGAADALALWPLIAVGHSLGGAVALALAARRSADVRGLVLLATCARLPAMDEPAHPLLPFLPGVLRKVIFFATAKNLLFAPSASSRAIGLGMRELRGCRPETLKHDVEVARAMDLRALAARIGVLTLVLCGTGDRLTPPALSEELHHRRLLPGSGGARGAHGAHRGAGHRQSPHRDVRELAPARARCQAPRAPLPC